MSKVWFITGAGSGIGTGIAKAALKAGDRVVATGRNLDKVRGAFRDDASENIAFVPLDVADEAQAKAAVEEAVKRFGRIDVAVNNAGYSLLGNFEEMTTRRHRTAVRDEPLRRRVGHAGRAAGHAEAAVGPRHQHQLRRGRGRVPALLHLRRIEVRGRGPLARGGDRGRAVRHQGHARRAGLLPHGPPGLPERPVARERHRGLRGRGQRRSHGGRRTTARSRETRRSWARRWSSSPAWRTRRSCSSPGATPSRRSSRPSRSGCGRPVRSKSCRSRRTGRSNRISDPVGVEVAGGLEAHLIAQVVEDPSERHD